jgi:hypothetical protein
MNKRILTLLLLTILTAFQVYAEKEFKDVIVTDKFICALTVSGNLNFFDLRSGQRSSYEITYQSPILQLTTDKLGSIIIVDKNNSIKRYNEQNKNWELISVVKNKLFGVLFDSKNQCFSITDEGILNIQTNKTYFSNTSLNHQIHYKDKWEKPYCYYIDKSDRIWIGFGYGEWGGNIFVFEVANNKFLTPQLESFNIELWPIKSFFEDDESTYLSSGLQHMMTSGTIVKFDNLRATTLFDSDSEWSDPLVMDSTRTMRNAEYIGPATYSKFDNSIYFYSQNGIFKGDISKDLSKIKNWKNILQPKLHWINGQPDAVGSPMNVLKLIIVGKDRFIFLTQKDGIGFFTGEKLIMLE